MGRDFVRNIDQRDIRTNAQNDTFHRTRVMIATAEIAKQRDDGPSHPLLGVPCIIVEPLLT